MTLRNFIKQNLKVIDEYIRSKIMVIKLDDEERRLWILNDEDLYNWAKREGVNI